MAGAVKAASFTVVQGRLRSVVAELEKIATERVQLRKHASEIRRRALHDGFDLPALTETLRLRSMPGDRRKIVDIYLDALGGR